MVAQWPQASSRPHAGDALLGLRARALCALLAEVAGAGTWGRGHEGRGEAGFAGVVT